MINRLLSEDHGQRVMVMVNDFGAVNIDADLLKSREGDTIELTNGCVCCTMGADLYLALGDVLDQEPRPDHLVIEASGIADPSKIANAAKAEPDMAYGGIALVVDGENFATSAADAQIGVQIKGQVAVGDLLLVSKCGAAVPGGLAMQLAALSPAPIVALDGLSAVGPLLLGGIEPGKGRGAGVGHGDYVTWNAEVPEVFDLAALRAKLEAAPDGIYRIKGVLRGVESGLEFHRVGRSVEIARVAQPELGRVVGIGPAAKIKAAQIEAWWAGGDA
ncbi:CobW family GTP-binding protein [Aquicoccus sp. G2-2]|uniref:CobW family GTP-binding protein n=1 Tax=Aquicoccus sp. G2-2 TaxID=3092120 RepID=UPI002AE0696B|nr:GTP-binding protein [Aquicoccus sp. G2-2]MEA1113625.1 GTP-binding protein [Aquicoccus sp. G2-2]